MIMQRKNFSTPDHAQTSLNTNVDTISIGDATITRYTYLPGWRWSKDSKSKEGTQSCQVHHVGVWISGRMHVKSDDGKEVEYCPGDVMDIPPGHDSWVVGDEPAVYYGFQSRTAFK